MGNNFNTPEEIIRANIAGGVVKTNRPMHQMILMSIMAGAFIAFGGATSNVAVHGIADVGLSRTLAGAIFPLGLMLVVLAGGELFTGNCLISMAVLDKKTTFGKMAHCLAIVYIGNLIGSFCVSLMVYYSGELNYSAGGLGAYTIKVALAKVTIEPAAGILSGILCNMLVCLAIILAGAARDVAGKIFSFFFPIWAFVVGGFEHCVANMYYIPAGILAAGNPDYVARAGELYGITPQQCAKINAVGMIHNLIPVTVGNIIGGGIFVGVIYFFMLIWRSEKPEN